MQHFMVTVVVVCGMALAIAWFVRVWDASTTASSSAPGIYNQTFAGTELRPLGMPDGTLFAPGTGGGAVLPAIQH